jgi:pimeloyl-ACP methyl ester carboxylesterase
VPPLAGFGFSTPTAGDMNHWNFENGHTRDWFNPVYLKVHARGHFVPWENPEAVIDDVRTTFRKLRD